MTVSEASRLAVIALKESRYSADSRIYLRMYSKIMEQISQLVIDDVLPPPPRYQQRFNKSGTIYSQTNALQVSMPTEKITVKDIK